MFSIEIQANAVSRERLGALVSHLTDEELALPAGDGWTVAAFLAHLAFWDYRVVELVRRWKVTGVGGSPVDTDSINDAMKPLLLALPGRKAALLAVQAAQAADAELEHLPESLLPGIEALVKDGRFRPNRSVHRNNHMDQIEKALAAAREKG